MRKSTSEIPVELGVARQRILCGRVVSPSSVDTTLSAVDDFVAIGVGAGGAAPAEPVDEPQLTPNVIRLATKSNRAARRLVNPRSALQNDFIATSPHTTVRSWAWMPDARETRTWGPEFVRDVRVLGSGRIHVADGCVEGVRGTAPERPSTSGRTAPAAPFRVELVRGLLRGRTEQALRSAVSHHRQPAGGRGAKTGGVSQGMGAVGPGAVAGEPHRIPV